MKEDEQRLHHLLDDISLRLYTNGIAHVVGEFTKHKKIDPKPEESLRLYTNGIAHVVGEFIKHKKIDPKPEDDTKIFLTGIPSKVLLDSVHFALGSKDIAITDVRRVTPSSLTEIALSYVGEQIHIDGSNTEVTLISVLNPPSSIPTLFVRRERHVFTITANQATFDYLTPNDLNSRDITLSSGLEIKLSDTLPANTKAQISYLVEGIQVNPCYRITLVDDSLRIAAEVSINNNTGKSFSGVDVTVVPGEVTKSYDSGMRFLGENAPVMRRVVAPGVEREESGGQISYRLGKRDVSNGESKFTLFTTTEAIDYSVKYFATLNRERPNVGSWLEFKAPETLPGGSVAVYKERVSAESTELTYEGGTNIDTTQRDEMISIPLNKPDTLEVMVKKGHRETDKVDNSSDVYATIQDYTVTITNTGNTAATLTLSLDLDQYASLLKSNITHEEKEEYHLGRKWNKWNITVPSDEKVKLEYTVLENHYKQVPLTREEVIRKIK
ncbi:hypothetical protein J4232_03725 [Candidatus Woesearchaeota archaeon]|nr:hypothetical protein [Candidatus Woesearchaeota archaeon]